jgi:hypothetical protein
VPGRALDRNLIVQVETLEETLRRQAKARGITIKLVSPRPRNTLQRPWVVTVISYLQIRGRAHEEPDCATFHIGPDLPGRPLHIEQWAIVNKGPTRLRAHGQRGRIPLATFERAALLSVRRGPGSYPWAIHDGKLIDLHPPKPEPRKPRAFGPTRLEQIKLAARVYREAHRSGDRAPTKAAAAACNVSPSQAKRYLTEARNLGMLGHAIPRRAGEQTS